jgi:hypothetical protein
MQVQTLKELLIWVLSGGGAGILAYWLISQLDAAGLLAKWTSEAVRYLSLAGAGLFAVIASIGGMALGYWAWPIGATAWVETLFSVIAVALGLSQALHGAFKLRGQARALRPPKVNKSSRPIDTAGPARRA